ncbi:hypothetical protein SD77_0038 [Bacillus badius]|uniref:Uncharacterized protein n=1 Tax=Bacillus badius TaxID=1455 RepID=A0ABR5AZY2_BACBA|nr:hypothetical protein SD78_3362 [Bacillus badius]KIL80190.1 hypothetical protein SD77_0038 [Bacillus badius]
MKSGWDGAFYFACEWKLLISNPSTACTVSAKMKISLNMEKDYFTVYIEGERG